MPVSGISVYPTPCCAPGADVAGAEETAVAVDWYFSMSDLIIRPPGPVPLSCFRGTPRSRARRRAMGEARMGPPKSGVGVEESSFAGFGGGVGSFFSSFGGSFSSFGGGSCSSEGLAAAFLPPASSMVKSLKASTEDSSSTITAIGYNPPCQPVPREVGRCSGGGFFWGVTFPTATSFSPESTRILARYPSS